MDIGIIGAPVDLGADRRGVDMGASAIRYAGLESELSVGGHSVRDYGNIVVQIAESIDDGHTRLKYLQPIVSMAESLCDAVEGIVCDGRTPLVLGGDHSISLGSVAGITRRHTAGIIWLDAHGDFNVADTSPSGNIHGMVLSALAGEGDGRLTAIGGRDPKIDSAKIVLVGVRELDAGERVLLRRCGVLVFTMHEVDRAGLPSIMEQAIRRAAEGVDGIHLSLDLDVVDPLQAPGVGTPVYGGLSFRETHLAMEMIAESGKLISMDLVEVNPVLDNHNETARLATSFALSAFGKRII